MSTTSQGVIDRLNIFQIFLKEYIFFGNSSRNNVGPIFIVALTEIKSNKVTKSSFSKHKFKVYTACQPRLFINIITKTYPANPGDKKFS